MIAAVYLRVSSKSQKVASQRRAIQQYLDGHKIDVPADRWFVDHGWSGKSLDRPDMDALQRAVFMGDVDMIVVYSLDRLARNALEGMTLLADWLKRGVRLVYLHASHCGYSRFSLLRASSVVNRQSTGFRTALRSRSHAPTSLTNVGLTGILRSRHCRPNTFNSISAMSSQLPCLGVYTGSNRSIKRRASVGVNAA